MKEIIDLSQEIYEGMPVYKGMPNVKISIHASHEEWEGIENPETVTPSVYKLELGEHTGSHVDSISHMGKEFHMQTIDKMPLSMFYTSGFCLDFSQKGLQELITSNEILQACKKEDITIQKGDTILLYTNHYRKHFNSANWSKGPGITAEAAEWLGSQEIAAFGVETMSPGVPRVSNKEVHHICGRMGFTHYENLMNLHLLVGRGRFQFIGLPLKIRGGTGSPIRAVAVFS